VSHPARVPDAGKALVPTRPSRHPPRVIEEGFAGGDDADEQAGEFGQLRWSERSAFVQPPQIVMDCGEVE